jgi:predicted anti-sigma-YlaC factor YlaD
MSERESRCASIRPLLFAAIDGEVSREERLEVHAHLAICEPCRSWERGERALTALLTDARTGRPAARTGSDARRRGRPRVLALAGALAIGALVLFVLPAATPHGTVVQRQLGPGLDWQVRSERAVGGKDVVDVPAAATATVQLGDGVQLESVGPARFALDASGRRWRVAVLLGTRSLRTTH